MFYEELKKHRESQGITLDQIADKTKININTLKAFESGNFSKLPRTYIRLFLKAYAQEVNLDPKKVIAQYEEYSGGAPEKPKSAAPIPENTATAINKNNVAPVAKKRNIAAITTVLVILIFLISILKQVLIEEEKQNQPAVPLAIQQIPLPDQTTDTVKTVEEKNTDQTTPIITPEIPQPSLSLLMTTSDTCWVRVITDEGDALEANYLPNIRREWKANEKFDVLIGRPSKVRLYLNDKELGPLGKAGIPTRLIITKDGIVRSTLIHR
jgi:cytoskeletal protein RodZ